MKQTIRVKTFETNSSSTHSLILVNSDEFEKFKNKELYFYIFADKFITKKDIATLPEFEENYPNYNDFDEQTLNESIDEFIYENCDGDYPVLGTYNSIDLCTQEVYDKDGNKQIAFSYYIPG